MDYLVITMNIIISVVFIGLLIAATVVPEHRLSAIVSASNGVLGIVGISICIAWFYFGWRTSTILMKSANNIKDSCADALDEALRLRKRLLRLTFIIGLCFFTQSIISSISMVEHLQFNLFNKHFFNFATVWASCDIIIFLTFILFYKTHVLRQRKIYIMDQQERELERAAKRRQRDGSKQSSTHIKSNATIHKEESQSYGLFRRLTSIDIPRVSIIFRNEDSKKLPNRKSISRKSISRNTNTGSAKSDRTAKSRENSTKDYQQPPTTIEEEMELGLAMGVVSDNLKSSNDRQIKTASLRNKFEHKMHQKAKKNKGVKGVKLR